MILRTDLSAVEDLPTEGVDTDQKHAAPFLAGTVDVQDVAATTFHVGTQQPYALMVDDLEIGDELPGEVTDGADRHIDAVMTRELDSDLFTLAASQEPRQTHTGKDVVGILRPRSDDALQLLGACHWKFGMRRAVALPFNGYEGAVGGGLDIPSIRAPNAQKLTASRTGFSVILPREEELRSRTSVLPGKNRGFQLLLP